MDKAALDERQTAVAAFRDIAEQLSQDDESLAALRTMTFWGGAGFSKAWNPQSPTEGTLFSISRAEIETFKNLSHVLKALGWDENDGIGFEGFKTLQYVIDMQLKYPDIRNRYLDEQSLVLSIQEIRTFIQNRFRSLCDLNNIDMETSKFPTPPVLSENQQAIHKFFEDLTGLCGGRSSDNDGLILNFITTNYDFTIETILDNLGAADRPIYRRLYRGITPHLVCGRSIWDQRRSVFDHNLIKLNGGFEILRDREGYHFEYRNRPPEAVRNNPPILILPSREQDYTDPYFKEIFPKAVRVLRETRILVIVGYSMPREDALVRFVLRQLAESGEDARGKHIFCIDLKGSPILDTRLRWTFNSIDRMGWPKVFYYPGKFEDFCAEARLT
ncbi:MAG: hypothetical protein GKS00_06100 [Alphaproteobacteria bacterium]|nr:hypothetical protein [Alphaproteobacteria bacterium]